MERGINLVFPYALRTGHDVKVVEIKTRRRRYNMIALWHQHQISVVDSNRLIKAVVSVDALKGITIVGLQVMVIRLLQVRLIWRVLGIMFVRGE